MKTKTLKELKTKMEAFKELYEYDPLVYVTGTLRFRNGTEYGAIEWRVFDVARVDNSGESPLGVFMGESENRQYVFPYNDCVYSIFQK